MTATGHLPPDGTAAGAVVIAAHGLRVTVAPEGGRIASIVVEATGTELLARTPWADDPVDSWTLPSSSAEWHRRYPGGWHLLAPAAGDSPDGAEVAQPFHGEAAWRTWRLREADSDDGSAVMAEVLLRTVPLRIRRTVSLHADGVRIETRLRNEGPHEQRVGWVEHPAFAGELFDDADLLLDGDPVPVVAAPGSAFAELPARTGEVLLQSRSAGIDLRLSWDAGLLPHLYLWQERRGTAGFPWWGSVDAVGVEPASDPYGRAHPGTGSVVVAAGAECVSHIALSVSARR